MYGLKCWQAGGGGLLWLPLLLFQLLRRVCRAPALFCLREQAYARAQFGTPLPQCPDWQRPRHAASPTKHWARCHRQWMRWHRALRMIENSGKSTWSGPVDDCRSSSSCRGVPICLKTRAWASRWHHIRLRHCVGACRVGITSESGTRRHWGGRAKKRKIFPPNERTL